MKKLMFGLAAVAAGSVMAIESQNVVGYQDNGVADGYSMITPTFVAIDGKPMPVDSIVVKGVDDGTTSVQIVNPDGSWGQKGVWLNAFEEYPAGWFTDASGETPAVISVKPGQGMFFYTPGKGASVQTAGQVAGDVTINVPAGYSMIGNTTPVAVEIDSITVKGVDDGTTSVQVVNPDGSWGKKGVWLNAFEEYPAGWFTDASGETSAEIVLEPGQSVFFYTPNAGASVKVPTALK